MLRQIGKFSALLVLILPVSMPALAFAQSTVGAPSATPPSTIGNNATFTLQDPLGIKNFCDLVKALLNIVLAIGMPVAVLFLVWSGFRFIFARGSEEGLRTAKKNFMYVIIGIAVFLGAWTLATIISSTIQTLDTSGTVQFCGR